MSFEEQIKDAKGKKYEWIVPVAKMIAERSDIRDKLDDEKKSLEKCAAFVIAEMKKRVKERSGVQTVCVEDKEVVSLIIHYYDENINVDDMSLDNAEVEVSPAISKNDGKEKEKLMAIIKEKDEEIEELKRKRKKPKKKKENDEIRQMSLFDL